MWSILLAFFFVSSVLAQREINATIHWNVSVPNDSPDRKYEAFLYDKNAPASLLLASTIDWKAGAFAPFQTQVIRALDPDTGKVLWTSMNEYKVAAWNNYVILAVTGPDSNNIQGVQPITKKTLFTTNNAVKGLKGCTISGSRFALILGGSILNGGNVLSVFSTEEGSLLWTHTYGPQVQLQTLTACGTGDFCVTVTSGSSSNVTYVEGASGETRWSYPGSTISRGGQNHILVGDAQMFGANNMVLLTADAGTPLWTYSLGSSRYAYGMSIQGDMVYLNVVCMSTCFFEVPKIQKEKRDTENSYPSCTIGLGLSDGKIRYQTGGRGYLSFFKNGDFAVLSDSAIQRFNGHTGNRQCGIFAVQDYSISTRPGIDNENDRFFAIAYGYGWGSQHFMSLSCPK